MNENSESIKICIQNDSSIYDHRYSTESDNCIIFGECCNNTVECCGIIVIIVSFFNWCGCG